MYFLLVLCFWGLLLKSTHLLSFLIGLEFLGLLVFLGVIITQLQVAGSLLLVLFLLGAMGCESAVGLVLFVVLTRFNSKDYLMHMNMMKF